MLSAARRAQLDGFTSTPRHTAAHYLWCVAKLQPFIVVTPVEGVWTISLDMRPTGKQLNVIGQQRIRQHIQELQSGAMPSNPPPNTVAVCASERTAQRLAQAIARVCRDPVAQS